MNEFIDYIKSFFPIITGMFELIAVTIMTVGSLDVIYYFAYETFHKKYTSTDRFNKFRINLARSIAAGLELTIVADLINTTLNVTYYKLGMLLILVIIRTIIGYFLNKDLENISLR